MDINICNVGAAKYVNGSCDEGIGLNYTCDCYPGFSGFNCSTDDDFCNDTYCMNGGTCVEGVGTDVSCNCLQGFNGDHSV